jgi:hypothetical protein
MSIAERTAVADNHVEENVLIFAKPNSCPLATRIKGERSYFRYPHAQFWGLSPSCDYRRSHQVMYEFSARRGIGDAMFTDAYPSADAFDHGCHYDSQYPTLASAAPIVRYPPV